MRSRKFAVRWQAQLSNGMVASDSKGTTFYYLTDCLGDMFIAKSQKYCSFSVLLIYILLVYVLYYCMSEGH